MSETDPWKVAKSTIRARIADYSVALLGHSSGSQQAKENAQTAIDVAIDAARAAEAAQLRGRSQVAMRDKPSPELMRALETLGKRPVQPPATPQEPEPYGPFFDPCGKCVTRTHCAHHDRCLAECVPADLRASTPSPEGQTTWQPIETAPKDGKGHLSVPSAVFEVSHDETREDCESAVEQFERGDYTFSARRAPLPLDIIKTSENQP